MDSDKATKLASAVTNQFINIASKTQAASRCLGFWVLLCSRGHALGVLHWLIGAIFS